MKDSKENTKIKLINKILVSFLSLLLVFSSVTSYQFQQKETQVHAVGEHTVTDLRAYLFALILAAYGITITTADNISTQLDNVYNNLNSNAKYIVDHIDWSAQYKDGYIALASSTYALLSRGILEAVNAFNMTPNTQYYWSPENFLSNDSYWSFGTPYTVTNNPSGFLSGSVINQYTFGSISSLMPGVSIVDLKSNIQTKKMFNITFQNFTYFKTMFVFVPLSTFRSTSYSDSYVGTILPTDNVLALKVFTDATNASTVTYNGYINASTYSATTYPERYLPYSLTNSLGTQLDSLGLYMLMSGLSLPDDPNDLQVPENWTKELDLPNLGKSLLIGSFIGSGAQLILNNLIPPNVPVPPTTPTPFNPPSVDPDPIVIDPTPIPDPSVPVTDLPSLWGAITGATAAFLQNLFSGLQPIIDLLQGIKTFLQTMVQPVVDAIVQLGLDLITGLTTAFQTMLQTLLEAMIVPFIQAFAQLWTWDITTTQLKIEELRQLMFLRIPCVNETLEAWYKIIAVNGHNLTSSFTIFGHTYTWSSGSLLQAFSQFASLIQQAFRFVFWFIFLKGMRRRITAFLSAMSVER